MTASFATEHDAKACLEALLRPHFALQREVWVKHLEAGNRLRIDYLGRPRPNIELPFPFHWFGVEVKKSCEDGSLYNDAIEQAIDYTHCAVDDPRPLLAAINGQRIARVYVFPARGGPHCWLRDDSGFNIGYCVNRLAGKFHVGMIYESRDDPLFFLQC